MIGIDGLHHFSEALSHLDLVPVQQSALETAAGRLVQSVKELLSHTPGSDHATPWLQTGALRESIASEASAEEAVVGSTDPVAVYQEMGTHAVPPRPFLSSAAAAHGEEIARSVTQAIVTALRDAIR